MSSWDYWALAAILLAGVPHGGFDGAVARRAGWSQRPFDWLVFHAGYIVLAALVTTVWWYQPAASLAVFLAISAIHFGSSDVRAIAPPWQASCALPFAAHCGLVCIGIPGLQPHLVEPLFAVLVGAEASIWLLEAITLLLPVWLLAVIAYAAYAVFEVRWRNPASVLMALVAAAYWLPPLVSFSLYFCFVHSPSHSLRIWRSLLPEHRRRCVIEAVCYTLAAWITGLSLFLWYQNNHSFDLDSALLQLTFIGLAALTVPHMILVDVIDRKHG